MKTSAKRVILKNSAKNTLSGKYFASIMALLFFGMLTLFFNRFSYSINRSVCLSLIQTFRVSENSFLILICSYVIPFLLSIVINVLQVGLCFFFLNAAVGNQFFSSDLLYGYLRCFRKSLRLSGVMTLLSFVCLLPINVLVDAYNGVFVMTDGEIGLLLLIQLALLFVYFPINLSFSQAYYLMLDYPTLSATEILKRSTKIMKGKKLQLFNIQLSFLPLWFLVFLSFGVGLFWVLPYYKTTMTLYYLDLMKPENPA